MSPGPAGSHALDQSLPAAELSQLAALHPELQVRVAWHRNADQSLLKWLCDHGGQAAARAARVRLAARAGTQPAAAKAVTSPVQPHPGAASPPSAHTSDAAETVPASVSPPGDGPSGPADSRRTDPTPTSADSIDTPVDGVSVDIRPALSGTPLARRRVSADRDKVARKPAPRIPRAVKPASGDHAVDPLLGDVRTPWPPQPVVDQPATAPSAPAATVPARRQPPNQRSAALAASTAGQIAPTAGSPRDRLSPTPTTPRESPAATPQTAAFGPVLRALIIVAVLLLVTCVVVGALMISGFIDAAMTAIPPVGVVRRW
ncbi:MAG: hypothetical protein LBU05_04865 [Bifidobacteriaceae bacterium]|nr:hypothetical protein [Bifidobacteriaceae bacterium]